MGRATPRSVLQFRQYSEFVGEYGPADDDGVEKRRRMGGVHSVLHDLQPVARVEVFLSRHQPIARPDKTVVHGKRQLPVRRPHIVKDDPAIFLRGIRPVTQPVFQGTVSRFAGRLEDGPVHRELAAMGMCRRFGVRGAASEIWKAMNPLESCPRSQSHAFRKGRYLAGWRTRGMPGDAPDRTGKDGDAVMPHHTPCSDVELRPR